MQCLVNFKMKKRANISKRKKLYDSIDRMLDRVVNTSLVLSLKFSVQGRFGRRTKLPKWNTAFDFMDTY